jgi:hypothetical protein
MDYPRRNEVDARAIASHVSARYKPWRKTNRKALALDSTTKAILTSKQPPWDEKAEANLGKEAGQNWHSTSRSPAERADATKRADATISTSPTNATRATSIQENKDREGSTWLQEIHHERHMESVDGYNDQVFEEAMPTLNSSFRNLLTSQQGRPESPLSFLFFDPFTPSGINFSRGIRSSLHFYFKILRPFALHLVDGWEWPGNLSFIQASPALTYAIAAYASVFLSGCLKGGPGIVLPPPANANDAPLWPIPPWFRMHTCCLAELNPLLADPQKVDETSFQAILFLFRIAILLADGKTARMHYQALKRIPVLIGRKVLSFEKELAVAKVNIIDAFLYNSSM